MCPATQRKKKSSSSREPDRVNKSPPAGRIARRGTAMCRTGANICWLGGRCVRQELVNMWKYARHAGERMRQMVPTVRVGVHQRKDGDVERVPKLPHHQPAVDIWHTFPLMDTGRSRIPGKSFGS